MIFFGWGVGWGVGGCLTSNKWLEFGDDPDHEANRGILKDFFTATGHLRDQLLWRWLASGS